MKICVAFLLLFINIDCFGQGYDLNDFVEIPPDKFTTKDRERLNTSGTFFRAEMLNGKLAITDIPTRLNVVEYALPYGHVWTVGGRGFGGMTYYQPKDTTIKVITINNQLDTLKDYRNHWFAKLLGRDFDATRLKNKQFALYLQGHRVNTFFKYRNKIYFIEGEAGRDRYGYIYNIDLKRNGGSIKRVMILNDVYQALLINGSKMYLAAYKGFFVINNWKVVTEIKAPWQSLYPNGLVMTDKNTLYTGVYGGYAKIDLKKQSVTLYRYSGKQ